MSSFFEGVGTFLGDMANHVGAELDAQQAAADVMGMSETGGMRYLQRVVPTIVENRAMDNFIFLLKLRERDESEDYAVRVNATKFRMEAQRLARNIEED